MPYILFLSIVITALLKTIFILLTIYTKNTKCL